MKRINRAFIHKTFSWEEKLCLVFQIDTGNILSTIICISNNFAFLIQNILFIKVFMIANSSKYSCLILHTKYIFINIKYLSIHMVIYLIYASSNIYGINNFSKPPYCAPHYERISNLRTVVCFHMYVYM